MTIKLSADFDRMKTCISCALQRNEMETIGGTIASNQYFFAQQDYAVPIPAFIIISSKRHIQSIDEFSVEECSAFIGLLYDVRKAMRICLNIQIVYMIQEEDASHFHIWLFPRYDWMEQFGNKIKSVKPIMKWAQEHLKTLENFKEIEKAAETLKQIIKKHAELKL